MNTIARGLLPSIKYVRELGLAALLFLTACQPRSSSFTLIDGDQTQRIEFNSGALSSLLAQAGVTLGDYDRVLVNGSPVPLDLDSLLNSSVIQIRRALSVTLITPQSEQVVQTSALTVGQALHEMGLLFAPGDLLDPPAETALRPRLTITIRPARDLTVLIGDTEINIRSAAPTVAAVLAEARIPLVGLDSSLPPASEAPPPDGQIRVTRIFETVQTTLEPIPFTEQVIYSPDLPLGQNETLQSGVEGIAMLRLRIRYENGSEVSRETESKTVLREPQTHIVQSGEKIVLAPIGGNIPYEYWYATQMFASVYSPCASGTDSCSYGTASGARAGQGIVAVDYSIYSDLAGMKVYIPGYGLATIGDTGGGPIIETAFGVPRTQWIDLGFNDGEMIDMTGWVTVYFLAPAPAAIPYFLK